MNFICELCQNHNGKFENIVRMVDQLAERAVTHIKLQHMYADRLNFRPWFEVGCHLSNGEQTVIKRPFKEEYERLKKLEVSTENNLKFIELCKAAGKIPLTTCFTHEDLDSIIALGYRQIKIASYDCGSESLLERLKEKFEQIFVSTGASYVDEIERAAQLLYEEDPIFLHCVTIYPTPLDELKLGKLKFLQQLSSSGSVGFSDHTDADVDGILALKLASVMGASTFERHYRVDGRDDSRDGKVSITAQQVDEFFEFTKMSRSDQEEELRERGLSPMIQASYKGEDLALGATELMNRDYYRGRFGSRRGDRSSRELVMNWERW